MKQLSICLLTIISIKAQAQDLLIKYDFIKDKFTYIQNGREVKQPTIHKNYQVKVLVENLNPFVFIARCQWKQTVADDNSSTSGIAKMFTGLSSGAGGISSLLSGLNMSQFEEISSRSSNSLLENNLNAKMSLKNALESYNQLFGVEQTMNKIEFSTSKLASMKLNPYLPSDTLKNIATTLTGAAMAKLNIGNQKTFSVSNFINFSANLSNNLNEQFEKFKNYSSAFLTEYNTFSATNNNNFAEAGMDQTVKDMLAAASALKTKYSAQTINAKVEALEQQYESINYVPFSYACNYMATGDLVSLTLDFFQVSAASQNSGTYIPGGDATDTLRKIRSKSVNVMVHGDMKITTSVGLGFPTYFNNNKTWSNRDSIVTGSAGNNYAPCISTYINFYPYMGRNIHLGGTFGVGIPVQNEGTSALNFFLGGSAVLGSASKVVLHAGLAIGQLNVLSNGLKEHDNLGDKVTLPTTKKTFKTGAFFGISFALNK